MESLVSDSICDSYSRDVRATAFCGDRLDLLRQIPNGEVQLIVTSPPYNIGKEYEIKLSMDEYVRQQEETVSACCACLSDNGSLCYQVGNCLIDNKEIIPLDILLYQICLRNGLKLRNRIIWKYDHGLHSKTRFSGRYEVVLWFTKNDDFVFNLDSVRVPQKYPNKKSYKGSSKGKPSCNPKGKNPSDVWDIPRVSSSHCEKTAHPCQFPIELVERLVLSMTNVGDLVVDPYMGVGSSICAAVLRDRRGAGSDLISEYVDIAKERIGLALSKKLKTRPMDKMIEIY